MNIQNNDPLSGFRLLFWLAVGILAGIFVGQVIWPMCL